MYESMMDMRKGGMVVFINEDDNGEDFILIRNLNDLQHCTISGGWSYIIYEDEKLGFPRIEAWQEPGVVPKGKSRRFRYTNEGLLAAKDKCIKRVKELMQKS